MATWHVFALEQLLKHHFWFGLQFTHLQNNALPFLVTQHCMRGVSQGSLLKKQGGRIYHEGRGHQRATWTDQCLGSTWFGKHDFDLFQQGQTRYAALLASRRWQSVVQSEPWVEAAGFIRKAYLATFSTNMHTLTHDVLAPLRIQPVPCRALLPSPRIPGVQQGHTLAAASAEGRSCPGWSNRQLASKRGETKSPVLLLHKTSLCDSTGHQFRDLPRSPLLESSLGEEEGQQETKVHGGRDPRTTLVAFFSGIKFQKGNPR